MKKIIFYLVFIVCGTLAFAAATKKMYVAVKTTALKTGTTLFAKKTATVSYGDEVTVLETKGKWSLVSVNSNSSKKGWISTSALSKRKIIASGSKVSTNADELALAGKGFNSGIEAEYKKDGKVNYDAVDDMEAQIVTDDDIIPFINEGELTGESK